MTGVLTEAVQRLNLQPGQTAREVVNGHTAELRLLNDEPSPELAGQVMIQPWFDVPFQPIATIVVRQGPPQWPKPIEISESDLAPE